MAPFITIGSARVRKCPDISKSIMANPLLAAEYDAALNGGIEGEFIYKSCSVLLNWRHTCVDGSENTWAAAPADRSKGRNCRNCYRLNNIQDNFLTLNGERATICRNPEDSIMADDTLAAEYKPELNGGINGNLILKGCGIRVQWQHKCTDGVDHVWSATPKGRTQGRGCSRCDDLRYIFINADTRIRICEDPANSIMADPVLAAQYFPELNNGIDGVRIFSQCNAPVIWRHQCSHGCGETHTWSATVSNRTVFGRGCPHCVSCQCLV
ncbi:hypothetical protein JKP88DRAFT_243937 [Tribonema minus]|uniref:Treble clef zinc finger domain-containing protein n=1 Tax=Tribonema minus TaxID=303371 RepID=A0A835ZBZ8_9STRA|nr:hypothetical protein JKP88DRAFT_243937 [Tribonema minus]